MRSDFITTVPLAKRNVAEHGPGTAGGTALQLACTRFMRMGGGSLAAWAAPMASNVTTAIAIRMALLRG